MDLLLSLLQTVFKVVFPLLSVTVSDLYAGVLGDPLDNDVSIELVEAVSVHALVVADVFL